MTLHQFLKIARERRIPVAFQLEEPDGSWMARFVSKDSRRSFTIGRYPDGSPFIFGEPFGTEIERQMAMLGLRA